MILLIISQHLMKMSNNFNIVTEVLKETLFTCKFFKKFIYYYISKEKIITHNLSKNNLFNLDLLEQNNFFKIPIYCT